MSDFGRENRRDEISFLPLSNMEFAIGEIRGDVLDDLFISLLDEEIVPFGRMGVVMLVFRLSKSLGLQMLFPVFAVSGSTASSSLEILFYRFSAHIARRT